MNENNLQSVDCIKSKTMKMGLFAFGFVFNN